MNAAIVSGIYFISGLLGAAVKAYGSNDQVTFSRKSVGDLILGGLTGILLPLVTPSLIPSGANIVQQAAVVALLAYAGSDIIQNFLTKFGVTLPGGVPPIKSLAWLAVPFGLLIPGYASSQPAPNVLTRTDVTVASSATQLCPQNGSRIDCSCTNNDGSNAIRVGDANVTATRGQRVTAGGTFKAAATAAIFGVAESGAVGVSCTDQSR